MSDFDDIPDFADIPDADGFNDIPPAQTPPPDSGFFGPLIRSAGASIGDFYAKTIASASSIPRRWELDAHYDAAKARAKEELVAARAKVGPAESNALWEAYTRKMGDIELARTRETADMFQGMENYSQDVSRGANYAISRESEGAPVAATIGGIAGPTAAMLANLPLSAVPLVVNARDAASRAGFSGPVAATVGAVTGTAMAAAPLVAGRLVAPVTGALERGVAAQVSRVGASDAVAGSIGARTAGALVEGPVQGVALQLTHAGTTAIIDPDAALHSLGAADEWGTNVGVGSLMSLLFRGRTQKPYMFAKEREMREIAAKAEAEIQASKAVNANLAAESEAAVQSAAARFQEQQRLEMGKRLQQEDPIPATPAEALPPVDPATVQASAIRAAYEEGLLAAQNRERAELGARLQQEAPLPPELPLLDQPAARSVEPLPPVRPAEPLPEPPPARPAEPLPEPPPARPVEPPAAKPAPPAPAPAQRWGESLRDSPEVEAGMASVTIDVGGQPRQVAIDHVNASGQVMVRKGDKVIAIPDALIREVRFNEVDASGNESVRTFAKPQVTPKEPVDAPPARQAPVEAQAKRQPEAAPPADRVQEPAPVAPAAPAAMRNGGEPVALRDMAKLRAPVEGRVVEDVGTAGAVVERADGTFSAAATTARAVLNARKESRPATLAVDGERFPTADAARAKARQLDVTAGEAKDVFSAGKRREAAPAAAPVARVEKNVASVAGERVPVGEASAVEAVREVAGKAKAEGENAGMSQVDPAKGDRLKADLKAESKAAMSKVREKAPQKAALLEAVTDPLIELENGAHSAAPKALADLRKAARDFPAESVEGRVIREAMESLEVRELERAIRAGEGISEARADAVKAIQERLVNGVLRASVRDTGAPVADSLPPAQRDAALRDLAKKLGIELGDVGQPLTLNGERVSAVFDGRRVHVGEIRSLAEGEFLLGHEALHAEMRGMSAAGRQEVFDAVARALGTERSKAVAEVAERWGKSVEPNESARLEEIAADAAGMALMRNPQRVISNIDNPSIARRIVAALHRIGRAILDSVRGLAGARKATGRDQAALVRLGETLLRTRVDRVQMSRAKAERARETAQAETLAKVIQASKGIPAATKKPKPPDLGDSAAKLFGETGRRQWVGWWGRGSELARHFPEIDMLMQGNRDTRAQQHRQVAEAAAKTDDVMSLPTEAAERIGEKFAFPLRAENEARAMTRAEQVAFLVKEGATPKEVDQVMRLGDVAQAQQVQMLTALHRAKRIAGPVLTEAKYRAEAARERASPTPDKELAADLDILADVAKVVEDRAKRYYLPHLWDEALVHRVREVDAKGNTVDRFHFKSAAEAKQKVADIEAAGGTAFYATKAADNNAPNARTTTESDLVRLATQAGMDPVTLRQFLDEATPALVAGSTKARELRSRNVGGYMTDVRKVISRHVGAMANANRQLELAGIVTKASLDAQARRSDPQMKSHLEGWLSREGDAMLTGPAKDAPSKFIQEARAWAYVRAMSKPFAGARNVVSAATLNPALIATATGTGMTAVPAFGRVLRTGLAATSKQATGDALLALSWAFKKGGMEGMHRELKKRADGLAMAETVGRTVDKATAADLREAAKDGFFQDSNVRDFLLNSDPGAGSALQKVKAGAVYFDAITNAAMRVATFTSINQAARNFTPATWAKMKDRHGYQGPETPLDYAKWWTNKINGEYGREHVPEFFRKPGLTGEIGTAVYQFGSWSRNMSDNLYHMARIAVAERDPVAAGALAALLAQSVALYGLVYGTPLASGVVATIDAIVNTLGGEPGATQQDLAEAAAQAELDGDPDTAATLRWAHHGVMPETFSKYFAPGGLITTPFEAMARGQLPTAAAVSAGEDVFQGLGKIASGDAKGGLMQSLGLNTYGMAFSGEGESKDGRTRDPELDFVERLAAAGGIQPAVMARSYETQRTVSALREDYQSQVETLVDQFAAAYAAGDTATVDARRADLKRVVDEWRAGYEAAKPGVDKQRWAARGAVFPSLKFMVKEAVLRRIHGDATPIGRMSYGYRQMMSQEAGVTPAEPGASAEP